MREKIVLAWPYGRMAAQRAGTGLDDGRLGTRSLVLYPGASDNRRDHLTKDPPDSADSVRDRTHSLCLAVAMRSAPRPSLMLWDALMAIKSSFESVYLGATPAACVGNGGELSRLTIMITLRERVKKAWPSPRMLKGVEQVRGKRVDRGGLFGRGNGPCVDERTGVGVHGAGERR